MKTKKREQENLSAAQLEEQAMQNKVGNYPVCFLDQCPLHDQCLRWIVGQYVDTMPFAQNASSRPSSSRTSSMSAASTAGPAPSSTTGSRKTGYGSLEKNSGDADARHFFHISKR